MTSAFGRLQPVEDPPKHPFERPLSVIADRRCFRGLGAFGVNILEVT